MTAEIPSVGRWRTNGELMADVARLWLPDHLSVLDVTYGRGAFWAVYKPAVFLGLDLNPNYSDPKYGPVDFRFLPFEDQSWDVVVFDPPYKLNGTSAMGDLDLRYGISEPVRWQDRMELIRHGAAECARVANRVLLVKCQDQVASGKMRWQTDEVNEVVSACGFRKADRFEFGAFGPGRKQPAGRRQVHARHHATQLLVFTKGK